MQNFSLNNQKAPQNPMSNLKFTRFLLFVQRAAALVSINTVQLTLGHIPQYSKPTNQRMR